MGILQQVVAIMLRENVLRAAIVLVVVTLIIPIRIILVVQVVTIVIQTEDVLVYRIIMAEILDRSIQIVHTHVENGMESVRDA